MIIEDAKQEDLYDLAAIELELFGNDAFGVYILHEFFEDNILFKIVKNTEIGEIIGFYILNEHNPEENERESNDIGEMADSGIHLVNLALRKIYWHKGLGTKIIDQIKKFTQEKGYSYIILEVNTKNLRAINLYTKLGFKIKDTIEHYYLSGENAHVMLWEKISE